MGLHALGAFSKAIVDADVAACPTQLRKRLPKCHSAGLCFGMTLGKRNQHANPPHLFELLRTHRERARDRRAAERNKEISPPDLGGHVTLPRGAGPWQRYHSLIVHATTSHFVWAAQELQKCDNK